MWFNRQFGYETFTALIGVMRKKKIYTFIALYVMFFMVLGTSISAAQETVVPTAVKVRAAKHENSIRIVLTTKDYLVSNASVILAKNKTIKVDLRSAVAATAAGKEKPLIIFQTEKGAIKNDTSAELMKAVNIAVNGDSCIITVPSISDIKVSKLQSPSRIVIDALVESVPKEGSAAVAPPKPLTDQVSFRSIVIDAGHGGYDYGIRSAHFAEKDFVLLFARDFAALLSKGGKDVTLTRKTDQIMTLTERIGVVNRKMPDFLISFHIASAKDPVIYTLPERPESGVEPAATGNGDLKKRDVSKKVADAIAVNLEKELSLKSVRMTLPISLLVKSKVPAILIEIPSPDEFTYDKKVRDRMMLAILKGLASAVKEEKPAVPAAPKPEVKQPVKADDKAEKM
jgi:N-acetylmuramoyl-L-alanine amidase